MSDRIKPYGGGSKDRLTKLINLTNSTTLTRGIDFEYGQPQESIGQRTNTSVSILPLQSGYRTHQVNYRRLDINALAGLPPSWLKPVFVKSWPFSIHDNLAVINEALGLNLTESEVVNDIYEDEDQIKLTLRITENSLAWLPGSYQFKISKDLPLSSVWPIRVLIGLNPPAKLRRLYEE